MIFICFLTYLYKKNYQLAFSGFLFYGIIDFIKLFYFMELLIPSLLVRLPYLVFNMTKIFPDVRAEVTRQKWCLRFQGKQRF